MKSIIESISNRELAFLVWIFILLLIVVFKPSSRKTAAILFRMIFWSKLTVYFLSVAAYTTALVYLLWRMNLWDLSQVKNTIVWIFTVGIVSLFHISDKDKSNYLRETARDVLSITAVLQFLVGIYNFSLVVELVLIPLAFLLIGMVVVAERNTEHHYLARLLRKLIVFAGLFLICYTVFKIVTDFKSFANKGTLSDFLIPATLSFTFLPMVYLLPIIVTHNDVFTGIERRIKQPGLRRYARWKALLHFHINKTDLNRWRSLLFLNPVRSKSDVNKSIELIKQMKRKEKLSIPVEFEKGWSPYAAMKFLEKDGITTGYYQPDIGKEWLACSKYIDVDDNIPSSNISYYVEGNGDVATKLTLSLSVYEGKQGGFAVARFLTTSNTLFKTALNRTFPSDMENAFIKSEFWEVRIGNRIILFEKKYWENKNDGYNLNFTIKIDHSL